MDETWTIGELADVAGVSTRTIRHDEAEGLLIPIGRTDAGHRVFDGVGVSRLYRIVALRRLDLGLGEIRGLLDAPDAATALRTRRNDTGWTADSEPGNDQAPVRMAFLPSGQGLGAEHP